MKNIRCIFGFHNWSDWDKKEGTFYAYRYCIRDHCGQIELNWLKWIDELKLNKM